MRLPGLASVVAAFVAPWGCAVDGHPVPRLVAEWAAHTAPIHGLAVSPDGRRVVSTSDDGMLRVWNLADRAQVAALKGHQAQVWAAAFVSGGREVLSADWMGCFTLWDAGSGREVAAFGPRSGAHGVTTLAVSPDGRRVATGGFDSTVRLWDLTTRTELRTWTGHADTVWAVAFARDGRTVFSGSFDGDIRVWSVDADACVARWTEAEPEQRGWKRALLLSSDGGQLLAGGASSPRAWRVATGEQLPAFHGRHEDSVVALAIAADGRRLVTGGFDGQLALWDLAARKVLARWHAGQGEAVWAVAILADGRLLSAGASGTLRLWDVPR
jgi:WD40 repeat protein